MTYRDSLDTERRARIDLEPFLRRNSLNGQFVFTDKGRLSAELQRKYGDVFANRRGNSSVVSIEIKAEEENKYGNFFLETWSNLSRHTKGWMFNLDCDLLFYYFLTCKTLHVFDFQKLKNWAFTEISDIQYSGPIQEWTLRRQRKHLQMNDTWGHPVPIRFIHKHVTPITAFQILPDSEVRLAFYDQKIPFNSIQLSIL